MPTAPFDLDPVTALIIGTVVTLVVWAAQLFGITVNRYLGYAILFIAFLLIGYTIWRWIGKYPWPWSWKVSSLLALAVAFFGSIGLLDRVGQNKDRPVSQASPAPHDAVPSSTPPASDDKQPIHLAPLNLASKTAGIRKQQKKKADTMPTDEKHLDIGEESVVMGAVPAGTRVGSRSVVIGATDANGNVIIRSGAYGYGAYAGPNSVAIGAHAGAAGNTDAPEAKTKP